jgi:hypothetical protein
MKCLPNVELQYRVTDGGGSIPDLMNWLKLNQLLADFDET